MVAKDPTRDAVVAQDRLESHREFDSKLHLKPIELELASNRTPSLRKDAIPTIQTIYGGGIKSVTQGSSQLLRELRRKAEESNSPSSKKERYQHRMNVRIRLT